MCIYVDKPIGISFGKSGKKVCEENFPAVIYAFASFANLLINCFKQGY